MAERTKVKRGVYRPSTSIQAVADGDVDVTDWDIEELIRGRRRDRKGTFTGRPPKYIPRAVYAELRRRTMLEVYEEVRKAAIPAARALRQMASGEIEADANHLRAVQEVLDRFCGKAPQHVSVEASIQKPWQKALEGIARDAGDDDDEIIDAEVLDDDDEPW